MRTRILHLILIKIFTHLVSFAQSDISIQIKDYHRDSIWWGKMLGKRFVKNQIIIKSNDGYFHLKADTIYKKGLYNIAFNVNDQSPTIGFYIYLDPQQPNFSIQVDAGNPVKTAQINGSAETKLFYDYYHKMDSLLGKYYDLVDAWRLYENQDSFEKLVHHEQAIQEYQSFISGKYPSSFVTKIIEETKFEMPVLKGNLEDRKKQRQLFFDQSFTINNAPSNDFFWSNPLSILWLDMYAIRSHDAGLLQSESRLKNIVDKISSHAEGYHYYLNYLLNSFQRMSRFNMDKLYVYLVNEYVLKNKTPWLNQEETAKHKIQAIHIERLMVGKKAPDATLFNENQKKVILSSLQPTYAMLLFWSPDCSHCKKELPILNALLEKYQSKNIQLITVCNKTGAGVIACFEHMKTNYPNAKWMHLADADNQSRINSLYNVTSTPTTYILDRNKTIVYRRKGEMSEEELDVTLNRLN